jgi:hypothetical protein
MGRRLRIPGLLDILIVESPGEILAVADDPALSRRLSGFGPVLNALILRNVRKALRAPAGPLPSALPREDRQRAAGQRALADRLAPETQPWDADSLQAIARYLRGDRSRPLEALCQEAVGRLFVPGYRATRATWHAAETLDAATRSINPLRRAFWWLTSAVGRAQRTLGDAVDGDTAAVHATGIAVHSFLRSVRKLERAMADPVVRRTASARAILSGALTAPDAVLRRSPVHADTAAGLVAPGTLVMLRTGPATELSGDSRIALMSASWSFCPAHRTVPAMLAEIWRRATGETPEPASRPAEPAVQRHPA